MKKTNIFLVLGGIAAAGFYLFRRRMDETAQAAIKAKAKPVEVTKPKAAAVVVKKPTDKVLGMTSTSKAPVKMSLGGTTAQPIRSMMG